jgi:hypothetical protein
MGKPILVERPSVSTDLHGLPMYNECCNNTRASAPSGMKANTSNHVLSECHLSPICVLVKVCLSCDCYPPLA